jgi:hypothetical protein
MYFNIIHFCAKTSLKNFWLKFRTAPPLRVHNACIATKALTNYGPDGCVKLFTSFDMGVSASAFPLKGHRWAHEVRHFKALSYIPL